MSEVFKTPRPYMNTVRPMDLAEDFRTPSKYPSDSDESVSSSAESVATQSSNGGELSVLAEFDDLFRLVRHLRSNNESTEVAFVAFGHQTRMLCDLYFSTMKETKRLQHVLEQKSQECSDLEVKLGKARVLIDQEKTNVKTIKKENDTLRSLITRAQRMFMEDNVGCFNEEIRDRFSFLHTYTNHPEWDPNGPQLSAIKEVNSTGSMLSDFSYSRSEDDLDTSVLEKGWKKARPSTGGAPEPAPKKRRSSSNKVVEINPSDTVRATTTLTLSKKGPIRATSIIESIPKSIPGETASTNGQSVASGPPVNLVFESWARNSPRKSVGNLNNRQHTFQQKMTFVLDTCSVCEKRLRFGKTALKCKDCQALCHPECKRKLPLPCMQLIHTRNQRNNLGVVGDFTPTIPPMVPPIIVYCCKEIELRGLGEIGIYRISGSEREVKQLKEMFMRGRGIPSLSQIDIHVICATVKDFLRSLKEPLVTFGLWRTFVRAVELSDLSQIRSALYKAISDLPQPNRDTLAYLIKHLQKVAQAEDCKMPISNLAKVFAPTIVGYSSDDEHSANLLKETVQQALVMENLLHIPNEYWCSFVSDFNSIAPSSKLQQTPSTDSLLRPTVRNFFSPNRNNKRKQKYFPTP